MKYTGIAIFCGLLLPGCGEEPGDSATPYPGLDAGPIISDSLPEANTKSGLRFRFVTTPNLQSGGMAEMSEDGVIAIDGGYEVVIHEAKFALTRVRIIGDSTALDESSLIDRFELVWSEDTPKVMEFPQAPPGIYARLRGDIDSFIIKGEIGTEDQTDSKGFVINESGVEAELSFDLNDLVLEPGLEKVVTVPILLKPLVSAVKWGDVDENVNGELVVRDSPLACARASLERAFGGDDMSGERGECATDGDDGDDERDGGVDAGTGGGDDNGGDKGRVDAGVPTTGG